MQPADSVTLPPAAANDVALGVTEQPVGPSGAGGGETTVVLHVKVVPLTSVRLAQPLIVIVACAAALPGNPESTATAMTPAMDVIRNGFMRNPPCMAVGCPADSCIACMANPQRVHIQLYQ